MESILNLTVQPMPDDNPESIANAGRKLGTALAFVVIAMQAIVVSVLVFVPFNALH